MNYKKYILILLFILLLFSLVSCVVPDEDVLDLDYRTGNLGLLVNFMSGAVPDSIYENQDLEIVAEIRNVGAFNEPSGKIYLHGFDATVISFDRRIQSKDGVELNYLYQEIPKIMGKSAYQDGGYDRVSFVASSSDINLKSSKTYNPRFILSTCFNYKTVLSPTVCILPDSSVLKTSSVCKPSTISLSSQGAPVAVTKVETQVVGNNNKFYITIENVGNGRVILNNEESFSNCPLKLEDTDLDIVEFEVKIDNLEKPVCYPEGKVKLFNDKARIECVFSTLKDNEKIVSSPYTTPLQISLDYNYLISTKKEIKIIPT
ncbi:MAG: hypothetical protein ACLFPJ_02695 [Candidatus Woesearchaeota archaeon]